MAKPRLLTALPAQALLLSLILLVVPGGVVWLTRVHHTAMAEQEANSLHQLTEVLAGAVANAPEARAELEGDDPRAVFVHQVPGYIEIDGEDSDWAALKGNAVAYGTSHTLEVRQPYSEASNSFNLLVTTDQHHLFLLVEVTDDRVIYRDINNISVHRNDHLQIAFLDQDKQYRRYTFAPLQPGPTTAFEVSAVGSGSRSLRPNELIEAYWQATAHGYLVEIRLPQDGVTLPSFSLTVNDVDDGVERTLISTIGTAGTSHPEDLGRLALPANHTRALLSELLPPGHRAEVRNKKGLVVARAGAVTGSATRLAEVPIVTNGQLLATLALELSIKGQESMRELSVAAGLFILVTCVFVTFALYITARLKGLRLGIQGAVDRRGRVQPTLAGKIYDDEIGDLHRAFDRVRKRLEQYTRYLERLSGRLSHELRTPVTVVRTSLDNLSPDAADAVYVERAREGVSRLTTILNQMTEASRLEEALNPADAQYFDLAALVTALIEGYRQAFPATTLELEIEGAFEPIDGLPDLIAQMLDKLVSNAVEFAAPGTPVRIRLTREQHEAVLRVSNSGPQLPAGMSEELFDSMVSVRTDSRGTHLGLGLYIAKLVADFHGGTITAANREDTSGVIITVKLPLDRVVSRR